MSDLLELAARCEAAEGADRELDAEIACATGHPNLRPSHPDDFDGKFGYRPGDLKVEHGFLQAFHYTRSIDAALMLVPEGAGLTISRYWIASADGPVWSAEIAAGGLPDKPRLVFDCFDAATPALALCAAALRARSTEGEKIA